MIVATAGHIDHGKTRLVRTITGVDTDRLPEEKARSISIDLGFAHWQSVDGVVVGFVDVPGHERFVRNMLAGVCGIDFALLVVAADDGVMPQTIEHVQILDLLGIRTGLAVVTKIDRASAARIAEVRREIATLLQGTSLANVTILEASAANGQGLDEVKAAIALAAAPRPTTTHETRHFRLAVDRAFTIDGSGTVVTGTAFAGETAVGARLCVSPSGTRVRVRGLRTHGADIARVHAGQRCALNLTGIGVGDVARGDWICDEAIHAPVQRVDAELALLPGQSLVLTSATQVHVHLGAGDEMARIAPLRGHTITAGTRVPVQLMFDRPIAALHGDRFIVRDSGARHTLGGGIVLDPFAPATRRRSTERLAVLEALASASPADALRQWLGLTKAGVDLNRFETTFNLRPDAARTLYGLLDMVAVGAVPRIGLPRELHAALSERVLTRLREHHVSRPTALGMREVDLHAATAPALALGTFQSLLQDLAQTHLVTLGGGVARLPLHDATDNPADRALWERVYPQLLDAGIRAPTVTELAQDVGVDARTLRDLLFRRRTSGAVFRMADDRFYLRATLATFSATAAALGAANPDGMFTAAQYRDAVGTGRTLAIQILECLDSLGITLRVGNARRMHHDYVPVLGAATPLASNRPAPAVPPTAKQGRRENSRLH